MAKVALTSLIGLLSAQTVHGRGENGKAVFVSFPAGYGKLLIYML